ncbi:MAG: TolC family protein [Pseudomonadota bacterium]
MLLPLLSSSRLLPVCSPASALVLAMALAGCTTVTPPALPAGVPAAWAHGAVAPGTAPTAPAPELRAWWKVFGDAPLDRLVDEALAQNLELAQAAGRLRQARLLVVQSREAYLPSLSASERTLQDVAATDSYLHVSLDATWELGLFGARESARQIAQAAVDSSGAVEQGVRVSVVSEVVRQYIDLRAAQQQVLLLERVATLDARSAELAAVRLRTRLASPGEATQARAQAAQVQALLATPRQAVVQAAQALAVLTGRLAPDPAWLVPAPQPALGAVSIAQVPADLLRVRPDVRKAEAAVLDAAGQFGIARAELYPHVSIGASYLYAYNLTQNRRGGPTDRIPVIGPLIDIPLFDWGQRRTRVDIRNDALDMSLLAYRQAVLEGVSETETALSALAQQAGREKQLGLAAGALRQQADSQKTLARSGLGSEYEQLGSERSAVLAEAERAGARAAHALAFVAVYKALGGAPLPAPAAAETVAASQQGAAR